MMRPTTGTSVVSLLYLLASHISPCRTTELVVRKTVPAPLSVPPAQDWEGVDGPWNTFAVQIGTPAQTVRVFVSTAIQQVWSIMPLGCASLNVSMCNDRRGGTFNPNASSTWEPKGNYALLGQAYLGFNKPGLDIGEFGNDTVGVAYLGEQMPSMPKQVVANIATYDFMYGVLGINPKPTNFSTFDNPQDSWVTSLRKANLIPSISWGYTAGANYRFAQVLSSLTLGGYDKSRFVPNDVTWDLGTNNERDLLVVIQGVNTVGSTSSSTNLVPSSFTTPMYSYIDSTTPYIWLPKEVCDMFEQAFNLTWNSTTQLYHVSDAARATLLRTNPNVTFTIGTQPVGGKTVDISLPYQAFDKVARSPLGGLRDPTNYFPIKRAADPTQYTLGRTFLQEAYLTVDWERRKFNVSQCSWVADAKKWIVAIPSLEQLEESTGSLGAGAIAGIVVGVVLALGALLALFLILSRRKKRAAKMRLKAAEAAATSTIDSKSSTFDSSEKNDNVIPKAELDAGQTPTTMNGTFFNPEKQQDPHSAAESDASYTWLNPVEADSKQREIFEMPGDEPKMPEADGRQFSEKEAMRAREQIYNGVDAFDPQTPVSIDQRIRQSPVSPENVSEVFHHIGPRGNPVSPIDGSDGSRTMAFSPLSPLEGTVLNISPNSTNMSPNSTNISPHSTNLSSGSTNVSPDSTHLSPGTTTTAPERKRFSYED